MPGVRLLFHASVPCRHFRRRGAEVWAGGLALSLMLVSCHARAQTSAVPAKERSAAELPADMRRIGGTSTADAPCVMVDVAGHKAGHLDCASSKLRRAMHDAQERAPNAVTFAVPGATSPDTVTGVASQTATRQRMGNTFGKSVRPQRPPTLVHPSPLRRQP